MTMEKKRYSVSHQTEQELAAALKQLMAQKPLEKITIQEITGLCGMKRQNFYYHFEDIYDLMRWMFQQEAVSLLQNQEGVLFWQEGLLQLFQYLQDNREVCLCALHSLGREHIKHFFHSDIYALIHHTIERVGRELGDSRLLEDRGDTIDLMTHLYVVSLAGIMESWLAGEIDHTPEELVAFADGVLQDHMRGAALRLAEEGGGKK